MPYIRGNKYIQKVRVHLVMLMTMCSFVLPLNLTYAQSDGLLSPIVKAIGKLLEGVTNVNIESATLGIDKGIIAGAVVGIGRTVERNPFPTGSHDQYLVKDRMRLGYELGAGYVIAGTVSYVQEWTLVYPVETSLKGTLSRKFLVDLFLPLRVSKFEHSKLPQDYALIRESYLEGKGRLKLGGGIPLMVGNQASIGRIKLVSTMARRMKNGDVNLLRENSKFYKFAYELWLNLALFDLPVFNADRSWGHLSRVYNVIKQGDLQGNLRVEFIKALFSGRGERPLQEILTTEKIERKVESDFIQNYFGLNFFGVFSKDTYRREDLLTDTLYEYNEDGSLMRQSSKELWQMSDRHVHDWTTGLRSEVYRSDVFINGEPERTPEGIVRKILKPQLRLNLIVVDEETEQREYDEVYLPLANSLKKKNQKPLPENALLSDELPESRLEIEVHFNERDLNRILHTTEEQWFDHLEKITGRKKVYWLSAKESGFHSRDRRRLRQVKLPFHEIRLAKKLTGAMRLLEKARKASANDPVASLRLQAWALRRTFSVGNSAWDVRLLKVLRSIVGEPQFSGVKFHQYLPQQGKKERVVTIQSTSGEPQWIDRFEHQFVLSDPSEIYHFFDRENLSGFN